jgi:hypothetical protein
MGNYVFTGSNWILWQDSIYAKEEAAKAAEQPFGTPRPR